MKTPNMCFVCLCLFFNVISLAQELPDSLKKHIYYTYLSIELVSYGDTFKTNDSTTSRYRFVSCIRAGKRYLVFEKLSYQTKDIDKKKYIIPDNVKLANIFKLSDELFRGIHTPEDPKISITVENWKSYNNIILIVGINRYSICFDDCSRYFEVQAIDDEGNNADMPWD